MIHLHSPWLCLLGSACSGPACLPSAGLCLLPTLDVQDSHELIGLKPSNNRDFGIRRPHGAATLDVEV